MARPVRSHQLETRSQRLKLEVRRLPHVLKVSPGIRLGYRRNKGAGTWCVIVADGDGGSWMKRIGTADDYETADGQTIFDFWQGMDEARKLGRQSTDDNNDRPSTVAEAITRYRENLISRDANPCNADMVLTYLKTGLACRVVGMLTPKDVHDYRDEIIAGGVKRSTVNRIMRSFIAALNLTARIEQLTNGHAWKIGLLPDATEARNVVITEDQVLAVIAQAYRLSQRVGLYIETIAVTGARSKQVTRLLVDDLQENGTGARLMMPSSKKGKGVKRIERKPVPIPLAFAARLRAGARGRGAHDPLLISDFGKKWTWSMTRPHWLLIVAALDLPPGATQYCLRHTSITRALLRGVPVSLVASMHDTSPPMIEKHYAKYIQSAPGAQMMLECQVDYSPP